MRLRYFGIELDLALLDHAEHGLLRGEQGSGADARAALADDAVRGCGDVRFGTPPDQLATLRLYARPVRF